MYDKLKELILKNANDFNNNAIKEYNKKEEILRENNLKIVFKEKQEIEKKISHIKNNKSKYIYDSIFKDIKMKIIFIMIFTTGLFFLIKGLWIWSFESYISIFLFVFQILICCGLIFSIKSCANYELMVNENKFKYLNNEYDYLKKYDNIEKIDNFEISFQDILNAHENKNFDDFFYSTISLDILKEIMSYTNDNVIKLKFKNRNNIGIHYKELITILNEEKII